jgi:hypothetical protein
VLGAPAAPAARAEQAKEAESAAPMGLARMQATIPSMSPSMLATPEQLLDCEHVETMSGAVRRAYPPPESWYSAIGALQDSESAGAQLACLRRIHPQFAIPAAQHR